MSDRVDDQQNTIFSSQDADTDKKIKSKKRLTARIGGPYSYNQLSLKDWFLYLEERIYQGVLLIRIQIYQNIPSTSAWLVINSVLGYIAPIPDRYDRALDVLGLQHMIAVSGFHISFLVVLLGFLFRKSINRTASALCICLVIGIYWLAVGIQPSVNRAVTMSLVTFISREYFFLQVDYIRLILVVALIWIIMDPFVLMSVSFQLSYLATLGILVFSNESNVIASLESNTYSGVEKSTLKNMLRDSLQVSAVAQIYTTGVIWYYFQQYPAISLVANALIFWLPPFLILLGIVSVSLAVITFLPMPISVIGSVGLNMIIALLADVITSFLLIGINFEKLLLKLPKLETQEFIYFLFFIALLTLVQIKKLRKKPERVICLSRIIR